LDEKKYFFLARVRDVVTKVLQGNVAFKVRGSEKFFWAVIKVNYNHRSVMVNVITI
jgi:hypothetical protein